MKALAVFLLLLVAIPELTLARPVVEESYGGIVGVEVGDWVKYGNFHAAWSSNDPSAQETPLDLAEHNNTEWVTNTVQSISGTNITFQTVTRFKNGTETISVSHVDVYNGEGNGTLSFISANLDSLEIIYQSEEYVSMWINETVQLVYSNALRDTNYLEASASQYWPGEVGQNLVWKIEYFWDKMTGVLTERAGTFANYTGVYETVAITQEFLVDTNLWEEDPDVTAPLAEAGPDQRVSVDQTVGFDAGGSSDNEGGWGIASYEWDFGDGTQSTGMTVTHAFNTPGKYTVTLIVEDWGGNSDEDTLTVTVEEASFPLERIGVVVLIMLLVGGLVFWMLKRRW